MTFNPLEVEWLLTHGGRDEHDVFLDHEDKCVWMSDGHGDLEKIYIPSITRLKIEAASCNFKKKHKHG